MQAFNVSMESGSILQHCWHCGCECIDSVDHQKSRLESGQVTYTLHHLSDNTGMSNRHRPRDRLRPPVNMYVLGRAAVRSIVKCECVWIVTVALAELHALYKRIFSWFMLILSKTCTIQMYCEAIGHRSVIGWKCKRYQTTAQFHSQHLPMTHCKYVTERGK